MGLMKVSGLPTTVVEKEYRLTVAPPELVIYADGSAFLKIYAAKLVALTALTDPTLIERVRKAAEQITTPDEEDWTQNDARQVLEAVGVPPAPSHVLVERVPGHSMLLMRTAGPEIKRARKLRYSKKQPGLSLLKEMRAEGITVSPGTCMEVPVKLVETDTGLAVGVMLHRQRTRNLGETEPTE